MAANPRSGSRRLGYRGLSVVSNVPQTDLALAAIHDGASTSPDIADELGVSIKHAAAVINKLRRQGYVRWTGRVIPRPPGQKGGRECKVWMLSGRTAG